MEQQKPQPVDIGQGRDSYEVFHSEEFQALLKYLGVTVKRTMDITIVIEYNKPCIIIEKYQAERIPTGMIRTTCLHNEHYETCQPSMEKVSGPDEG